MKKLLISLSAILSAVFLSWFTIIFICIGSLFNSFYGITGFCGGIVALIVSLISILLWKYDTDRNTTEINGLTLVFTSLYFIIMLIVNGRFCFLTYSNCPKVLPVTTDFVITLLFIVIRIFILPYRDRVLRTTKSASEKTFNVSVISRKIASIINTSEDNSIKCELNKLKEEIDYSTNISQNSTSYLEHDFYDKLNQISYAINHGKSSEDILKLISEAKTLWNERNGASAAN